MLFQTLIFLTWKSRFDILDFKQLIHVTDLLEDKSICLYICIYKVDQM